MENNKTTANCYLAFSGNCREAMTFYEEALQGKLEIMPFEGSPMEVPDDYKNKVMHATLTFGDAMIMASDGMPGQEVSQGNNVHISINATTVDEAEKYFNNLSVGGQIIMPLADTFWGAKFGMLTDKFGVQWMVNCELEESK